MKDPSTVEAQSPDSSRVARPGGGFRAHLQGVGLHDLVMLQNLVRASAAFMVLSGDRSGVLHFSRGQLVHAEASGLIGDAAALEIMSWREGELINTERPSVERNTVASSLESLLLRLARDVDGTRATEPQLTSATGVRRRVEEPTLPRHTQQGLGALGVAPVARTLAAAATPGLALPPRAPTRAADSRSGVTNVLISPQGAWVDGNGADPEGLGSKVAYVVRLTELIGQAMGAGETRGVKVRTGSGELTLRRHLDGHVSASLGPAEAGGDGPPASTPHPPASRF